MSQKLVNQVCQECGGTITETPSDMVCGKCGLVCGPVFAENRLLRDSSILMYQNNGLNREIEKPSSLPDFGSLVGYYNQWDLSDTTGTRLLGKRSNQFRRLKRINDIYSKSQGRQRLYRSLQLLGVIAGVLEVPESVKDDAARIIKRNYDKLEDFYLVDFVAASIYLSSRLARYCVRVRDLLLAFEKEGLDVPGKNLLYAATQIRMISRLKHRTTSSEEYLEKVIQNVINDTGFQTTLKKLHIPSSEYGILLRKNSQRILNSIKKETRGGRDPYALACATVAGADLIIAQKFGKRRGFATQRLIAKLGDVPEFTLREHFLQIVKRVVPCLWELERSFNEDPLQTQPYYK